MKALSVRQPFAELIALGHKPIEVRSRRTSYRGPLVICSGAAWHADGVRLYGERGVRGVTVCVVELVDCRPVEPTDTDEACLPMEMLRPRDFAWVLARPRRVEPVAIKGRLGLFDVPNEIARTREVRA